VIVVDAGNSGAGLILAPGGDLDATCNHEVIP
jgi:hypothetical protein